MKDKILNPWIILFVVIFEVCAFLYIILFEGPLFQGEFLELMFLGNYWFITILLPIFITYLRFNITENGLVRLANQTWKHAFVVSIIIGSLTFCWTLFQSGDFISLGIFQAIILFGIPLIYWPGQWIGSLIIFAIARSVVRTPKIL